LVALRTEQMTMTAFQLEGVELAARLTDARFPAQLRVAAAVPAEPNNVDPRTSLRGPQGAENEAVLRRVIAEIGGAELPPLEFARRATAWLRARHAYALSVRLPPGAGRDDIVRWLDSNEPGFCEYFAGALTVLCRAAGHPARVVAGFHGGVLNGFENYYMVRNSDAHAWVEVHDGKAAWVRHDPTPGAVAGEAGAGAAAVRQEQDSSWSARVDSLRILWYRRIVNFDSRAQLQMFDQVKTLTTESGQALRQRFDAWSKDVKAWLQQPWDWARAGRSAGYAAAALVAAVAGLRLLRWGWSRWRGWGGRDAPDPVRQAAGRWLRRLRRSDRADATVVADLQRLRFGRRETWPEPRAVFRRARRERNRKAGKA
ncbi:MAG: transglutaminase domain-containing protein, partial [Opitutaceae bacterium]|nr:transglutaminase domain-containing protein [Opitutaceae bacterium]